MVNLDLRVMHGLLRLRVKLKMLLLVRQGVERIDLLQCFNLRHAFSDTSSPVQPVFGRLPRKYWVGCKLLLEPGELIRACAVGAGIKVDSGGKGAIKDGSTGERAGRRGGTRTAGVGRKTCSGVVVGRQRNVRVSCNPLQMVL